MDMFVVVTRNHWALVKSQTVVDLCELDHGSYRKIASGEYADIKLLAERLNKAVKIIEEKESK